MNALNCKLFTLVMLTAFSVSTAYAKETAISLADPLVVYPSIDQSTAFSHGVLTILSDPKNNQPWSKVITNQNDWKKLFFTGVEAMTFDVLTAPIAPIIDFEKYQILSGGLGVKPTSGYSVVVKEVRETKDNIVIDILEISPDTTMGCLNSMFLTYPSTTIFIKKTEKPLTFNVTKMTAQCSTTYLLPR